MKNSNGSLIKRFSKALKALLNFLEEHGVINVILENSVKLIFFIIVLYVFGKVIW